MRYFLLSAWVLFLSGCEFIAPSTSKAISESKQFVEMQRQTTVLISIANSLGKIAKEN